MTNPTPANNPNAIAQGAFGLLIIGAVVWLFASFGYYTWNGLSIPWATLFLPLGVVITVQFCFIWIGAVIRKSVAEGLVLGLTHMTIIQEAEENRKKVRTH